MTTKPLAIVAVIGSLALIAAGCGSSDSTSSSATTATTASTTTEPSAATGSGKAATIDVADNPDLGQILTDGDGNTVYLFEKDEGDESYCTGDCATAWPPVTTSGDPKAGSGADQSLLSTIQRDDGTEQVTYDGHPLYLYAGDTKPGETTGNGIDQFGAEWYALTPDGSNAEGSESSESSAEDSTSTDDSTSGGYSSY